MGQPQMARPPYLAAMIEGRDLILNRQYDEARKYFSGYGAGHPDDPIEEIGIALLEMLARLELRNFSPSAELDTVFEKAEHTAKAWEDNAPDPAFGIFSVAMAEAMQALWWLKTGHSFRGIPRALSAVDNLEAAARGASAAPDAQGAMGMYRYLRGKFGSKYVFFISDTRARGKLEIQRCVKEAPVLGPLCEIFLLYVAKWEGDWDWLDAQANDFRSRYPRNMFVALLQTESMVLANRFKRAQEILEQAREVDPDFALVHFWLGRLYWDGQKNAAAAQKSLELALEKKLYQSKRMAEAYVCLGEIAMEQGQYGEARIRFAWADRLDSGNPRVKADERRLKAILKTLP